MFRFRLWIANKLRSVDMWYRKEAAYYCFVKDYKKYLQFIKECLIKSTNRNGNDRLYIDTNELYIDGNELYIDTKKKTLMCYKTQFYSDKLPKEWYKTDNTNPFVDDSNNAFTDQCYDYIRRYLGLGRKDRYVIYDEYNHQKPLGCYKDGDMVTICVYYKKGIL